MWQWLYQGNWINCSEGNNQTLQKRYSTPSMEKIYLVNAFGEIWGTTEDNKLKFRIHGDDEETHTMVRMAPRDNECSIMHIEEAGGNVRIIPPSVCSQLFDGELPSATPCECESGTEKFISKDGKIYQQKEGTLVQVEIGNSGLSWGEYDELTKSRYTWEFNGPFRWERMRAAVNKTCGDLEDETKAARLLEIFSNFDPTEDMTEYGPYQFDDYLISRGELELSILLMENFHAVEQDGWKAFDPITNVKIERARNSNRPMAAVRARGHIYMLVFDAGAGASGCDPILIRPGRYQKILESIEEQYEASILRDRRGNMHKMFDLLMINNINPRDFLMRAITNRESFSDSLPETIRSEVVEIMSGFEREVSSNFSTYVQQFMPPLMQKFKECDVKLAMKEHITTRNLCPLVADTLKGGLRVPTNLKVGWKELIRFILKTQSWKTSSFPTNVCDICGDQESTLTHCGTNKACLKCWTSTLESTKFTCPFCRQDIKQGDLVLSAPPVKKRENRKRKRNTAASSKKYSVKSILEIIQKDELYKDITEDTSFGMRKWFTILLRRGLVNIHQTPTAPQVSKPFKDVVKIFKLV